ncbi:MAG: tetratricopeptide repeat protein [Nonlabens sp.]
MDCYGNNMELSTALRPHKMYMDYELNGDEELIIKKFESMLKSNEVGFFDSEEFEDIIEFYLEEGKIITARKAIALSIVQHPESVNLKLYQAEMLIMDNRLQEAYNVLNVLQQLEPSNAEIYIQKANIFSKTEKHEEAIRLLQIASRLTDDNADIFNLIGMEFLFLDDYSSARSNFTRCLEVDSEDDAALHNIIYCYEFLEDTHHAVEFLKGHIDKRPYNKVAWHQLGKQYLELCELEKGLEAFEYAIISDDLFIGAYFEKGKILERLGRFTEAIEVYSITLTIDDPTAFAYHRMALCHQKIGDRINAKNFYKKALEEDPLLTVAWVDMIDFYLELDQIQTALKYVEQATELEIDDSELWTRYAIVNNLLFKYEEAEYGYRKAIELGHLDENIWNHRADIFYKLGEFDAAINNLLHGLDFYPDQHGMTVRLAAYSYMNRNYAEGLFHLQNADKIDSRATVSFLRDIKALWNIESFVKDYSELR